jgi:hypothetical protein
MSLVSERMSFPSLFPVIILCEIRVRGAISWRLTKALCLRVVPDEAGTLKSLLNDLSNDIAHRFNFGKTVILRHEAVNFS